MREMKDSGIPWIGEIPKDWSVNRLKQESTFINGFAFDSEDFKIDEGVRVIRIGDIGLNADFENCIRAITNPSILTPYRIENGDILIAMSGATTGKCCIVDEAEEAYINQRVGIIRSNIHKIIYYSLQTPYFMEFVNLNNAGSAQPNISSKAIGEFPIIVMPKEEQQKIVEFLDRKCGEIDEMISLQEKVIEELKAYKQSIITETVTKGLNPNVAMRDSEIEWIGEMPEHWEVKRLKYLCHIQTGNKDTQDADDNGEYLFYVRSPFIERSISYSFEGEGILMAGDGVGAGRVFHHAFGKYAVHQRVYRLSDIININSYYLFYYISSLFNKIMDMGSAQSTVPSVRLPMLTNFIVCNPSLSEQQQIADYLDRKCAKIDELVAVKQQKIETLKEYKKSLIYEYVTGKKEI